MKFFLLIICMACLVINAVAADLTKSYSDTGNTFTQQKNSNLDVIEKNTETDLQFYNSIKNLDVKPNFKTKLPDDFLIGFSTAPYQYEGGAGFRGLTNWDNFLYGNQGTLGITGRDGTDFFNKYQEDLRRMKLMGINGLRVGISWSRLFYDGEENGKPKQIGVEFYKKLIQTIIDNGMTPIICLMHWDMPLTLQNNLTNDKMS